MGRQPLPAAAGVRALAALRAYGAHADPATRIGNTIALLVGFNGPFYPLYVWFLLPEARAGRARHHGHEPGIPRHPVAVAA